MYINVSFIFLSLFLSFNKIKQLYQIVFLVNPCWHLHICIKHVVNYIYIYFVYLFFSALINLTTGMRPFAPRTPGDINIEDVVKFSRQGGKLSQGKVKFVGHLPGRSDVYLGVELDKEGTVLFSNNRDGGWVDCQFLYELHVMSDCCLKPNEQFFSHIMMRTSCILMR